MKVRSIHQIEITSRCNLKCNYCVHKKMGRHKIDMEWEVFMQALRQAYSLNRFNQAELNLAGIGESTMHPEFQNMVARAREAVGPRVRLVIATNGLLFDEDLARAIAPYKPSVWVSLHRPEKAGQAVEVAKRYQMLHGISADPSIAAMNWAGKVEWHTSCPQNTPCPWLTKGQVMVTAEGDLTTCCLDGEGEGIIGHIYQDPSEWQEVKPYSLCEGCHHAIP